MYLYLPAGKSRPLIGVVTDFVFYRLSHRRPRGRLDLQYPIRVSVSCDHALGITPGDPVLAGVDVERGRADAWAWSSYGNEEHEVKGEVVVNR